MLNRGNKIVLALGILGGLTLLGILCLNVYRWREADGRARELQGMREALLASTRATEVRRPVAPEQSRGTIKRDLPAVAETQDGTVETGRTPVVAPVVAAPADEKTNGVARLPPRGDVPIDRQIQLANRTIELEKGRRSFPKGFAELQTPSTRGTVVYMVIPELSVSRIVRERAASCGARVLGFMPVNALIVEANAAALKALEEDVFFAGAYELDPGDKIPAGLRMVTQTKKTVDVTIHPLADADLTPLMVFVKEKGGTVIPVGGDPAFLRACVPSATVEALAGRGDVRWIERYVPASLHNNIAVKPGVMNVRPVWETHGLTGRGQFLTCADSGLDSGDPMTVMDDFRGRIVSIRQTSSATLKNDVFGHGTHVAGSLVGTGARSNDEIKGVAYGARLWVWGCATQAGELIFPNWTEMFQPDTNVCPAFVHSESWGYEDASKYSSECQSIDAWLWEHPEHLVVFSAGNTGGNGTICDPSGAKNVLSVGATENLRPSTSHGYYADNVSQVAYFSARGPMRDGRIKPDICAPGTMILSTRTREIPSNQTVGWEAYAANTNYTYNSGTSMATPLAAGATVLVREWLVERRGFTNELPTAALMKAILMGGAHDMSFDPGADCGGAAPNNLQGWGRIDLEETLYPSNRAIRLFDRIPFSAGSMVEFRVTVTNAAPLDVQLAWLDYPAEPSAWQALVNDLDLVVSNETTGVVWRGNGVGGGDRVNTVESVRIVAAEPATYVIRVKGTRVLYESTEGGAAAVYVRGAFVGDEEAQVEEKPDAMVLPLRHRTRFPRLDDWGATTVTMVPSGQVVRVSIPEDLPDGAERLTGMEWTDNLTGRKTRLEEQRLGDVVCAEYGASDGLPQLDAEGRMARSFDLPMVSATDVLYRYYGVSETNTTTELPEWWYRQYLSGTSRAHADADADGDGVSNKDEYAADTDPMDRDSVFRILVFSPTNIVWSGGHERTQVVERATQIGTGASWMGVFTNLPPTATRGEWLFPPGESCTNSFYRIRAF